MLVHEHACGDPAHVEAVQEVLDILVGDGVHAKRILVLHHTLSHGGHHVVVAIPDVYQSLCESGEKERMDLAVSVGTSVSWHWTHIPAKHSPNTSVKQMNILFAVLEFTVMAAVELIIPFLS